MKKIFLLSMILFLLTGCTNIEKSDIEKLLNEGLNSQVKTLNINRNGYRYYLPKGLKTFDSRDYNEILTNQKYKLYLYVDVVHYHSKVNYEYSINPDAYYSQSINSDDKKGYIEINNYKNDQYLIEIMYNYAKIEVIVYEKDINKSVLYAMVVLSSITYNDSVLEKYLSSSTLDYIE